MAAILDITKIMRDKQNLENSIHKTNEDFNNLLDIEIDNIAGGTPNPAPVTYEEKKKYILQNVNIYNTKSKDSVKKIMDDRKDALAKLKQSAFNLIQRHEEVISNNTDLLGKMFEKIAEDKKQKKNLEEQKDKNDIIYQENIKKKEYIEQEIDKLKNQLSAPNITEEQKKQIEADIQKNKDSLPLVEKEISESKKHNLNIAAMVNDLNTKISQSEKDHNNLKNKNNTFKDDLVKNKKDFEKQFANVGVEFNEKQSPNNNPEENAKENVTQTEPDTKEANAKDKGKGKGGAGGAVAASGSPANKEARTSEEFSSDMAKAITSLGLSPRKFREMLDGEGYSDLVAMVPNLDPRQKRTISNYLKVNAKDLELPDEIELNSAMATFGLDNVPYDLLIDAETGKPRDFASLSNQELNELKSIINVFNEDADKLSGIEAKELDKFMKVMSYNSLIYQCQKPNEKEIQKGPFKGIRRMVQDVKRDKNSDRDITCRNIVGSMNEYLTKRNELTNDFRASLGENVNTEPTYIDMSGKDDIMKKAEERGYQTKKTEKKTDDPVK